MKTPQLSAQKTAAKAARLEIYDDIGPSWFGMIDAKSVSSALKDMGDVTEIEVRINSRGGDCNEGLAIHNILKQHPANVIVIVDGIAASIASIIAMAGNVIRIPKNALMMIHDPWCYAWGSEEELMHAAAMLATYKKAAVATYAERSGRKPEEIASLMSAETWWTGEEAVAAGFATETAPEVKVDNSAAKVVANDLFRRAPANWSNLVALSIRKDPAMSLPTPAPAAANPTPAPAANPTPGTAAPANATLEAVAGTLLPVATQVVDVAAENEKAVSAEHNRTTQIFALCKTANCIDRAEAFIADRKATPETVRNGLFDALIAKNKPVGEPGTGDPAPADPQAKFKKEYAAHAGIFESQGVSEADYCASRAKDAA